MISLKSKLLAGRGSKYPISFSSSPAKIYLPPFVSSTTTNLSGTFRQLENSASVPLKHLFPHPLFELQFLKTFQPALRVDVGIIGAEDHFVRKQRVHVRDDRFGNILGEPSRQIDIEVCLMQAARQQLVFPRPTVMSCNDRNLGKIGGYIIQVDRPCIFQFDPHPSGLAHPQSRETTMKENGDIEIDALLVQRVDHRIVGEKILNRRVEFEPFETQIVDGPLQLRQRGLSLPGINAGKTDKTVRIFRYESSNVVVRHGWKACCGLRVPAKNHPEGHAGPVHILHNPVDLLYRVIHFEELIDGLQVVSPAVHEEICGGVHVDVDGTDGSHGKSPLSYFFPEPSRFRARMIRWIKFVP